MEKKTLGSFMAVLRKSKGMTQQDIADALNVSNKTISKWERDESSPDITIIPVLSEMLGVTCDELLKGERIISEEVRDKSNKIDKQVKYIVKNSIYKFKNLSIVAGVLVMMGLICMLTVSYAFDRPDIGFGIMLLFITGSIVTQFISINRFNNQFDENEIIDKEHIEKAYIIKFKYSYGIFFANFAVCLFVWPVIVEYLNSYVILIMNDYIRYYLLFNIFILVLVFCITKNLYKWSVLKVFKEKIVKYKDALWLNLVQFLGVAITGISFIVKLNTVVIINDNTMMVQSSGLSDYLTVILSLITIACFPIFLLISKNKKVIVNPGIRNTILIVAMLAILQITGSM